MAEKKCSYAIDPIKASVTVTRTADDGSTQALVVEMDASYKDVARRLALMGLVTVFQRAITKNKTQDPFDAIEAAAQDLKDNGLAAFERKVTPSTSKRGPTKAQCLAALAVMKNTTVPVIKDALAKKTKEEAAAILAHESVLAKVAEMQVAEVEL